MILSILNCFFQNKNTAGAPSHIIAGLGNPGRKYEFTRHNVGFVAVDLISQKLGTNVAKQKFSALTGISPLGGERCLFMKPQTFMNNSGEALRSAANFYKLSPERILVIYDDISLPVGQLRIRPKGGHGGHNGMKSIISHLKSEDFPRIRVGIGDKPRPDYDLASWVMSGFSEDESEPVKRAFENVISAAELIVNGKINEAMNKFN